jgi:hypothetical protein
MFEYEFSERQLHQLKEVIMSTVGAGLAALQQADQDLAAAITANTAEVAEAVSDIQSLAAQLSAATQGDSDSTVGQIAADLETKVAALSAATTALTSAVSPAPPPTPTPSS